MEALTALSATADSTRAATLWDQFAAPLRAFVTKRAPHEVDAEDVLQDVFVRIQAQLPALREVDRIDAWIFQIARNVVADTYRKRTRQKTLAERTAAEEPAPIANDDERSAETALASCLASMIGQLREPYRQAIELTEIRGLTQIEAAQRVGMSISGMKSRVQRGRAQLKAIIHGLCLIETDVRGHVIECDQRRPSGCGERLRPSPGSSDSMDMTNANELQTTETHTTTPSPSTGCCGGAAPKDSNACCLLDAEVKATGGSGCGCGAKTSSATTASTASTTATTSKKGCC